MQQETKLLSKEALCAQAVHRCKRSKDVQGQNQATSKAVHDAGADCLSVCVCVPALIMVSSPVKNSLFQMNMAGSLWKSRLERLLGVRISG